jgi:DNA-binding transcriptional ArsR family regulator
MNYTELSPLDQIDPAVALGVLPPPLPSIMSFRELCEVDIPVPPQIVDGVLHQGCKMILGGTSKSNKSWCLLDLAMSVASGQPWWGHRTAQAEVLYVNFELQDWAIQSRMKALCCARPECKQLGDNLHFWNLRGRNANLTVMRPALEEQLRQGRFGLIILDPAYKVLGDRDENANGDIADLMNELEGLAQSSGAAVVVAHHFAKGDSTTKAAMDRMSGAGAWVRDPDAILVMTPHEEEDCYTVTSILRNLPKAPEVVVRWDFPLMTVDAELNPESLKTPQSKNKKMTDKEFIDDVLTNKPIRYSDLETKGEKLGISKSTVARTLKRLTESGLIGYSTMGYWRKSDV